VLGFQNFEKQKKGSLAQHPLQGADKNRVQIGARAGCLFFAVAVTRVRMPSSTRPY
jgi:hypothetical protein